MKFKSFTWPIDPKNINISLIKNQQSYYLPGLGNVVQQSGPCYHIIEGCGELFEQDSTAQFQAISKLFFELSPGLLSLPFIDPLMANFTELAITGSPAPNTIAYKFKFVEDVNCCNFNCPNNDEKLYFIKGNENLWDVADKFKISINDILTLNPHISDPYAILPNEKVLLK